MGTPPHQRRRRPNGNRGRFFIAFYRPSLVTKLALHRGRVLQRIDVLDALAQLLQPLQRPGVTISGSLETRQFV